MQTTISNIPGPRSLDHSQWPQQLQARNEETKKKTFSLSVPLSLSNYSTCESPQNGSWPRPSTPALHSEIDIQCVLSLESTQRKQRSKLFYRAHQSWIQARIFLFKELINFSDLKPNCRIMRLGEKKEEKKKKSGLLWGWMKDKCKCLNTIISDSDLCWRSFEWNAKLFFFLSNK